MANRVGVGVESLRDRLQGKYEPVPTYEVIKDQGAKYIGTNYGRTFPKVFYTLPFSEQLTYAMEMERGRPVYTKGLTYGGRPDQKIMAFAMRSWNQTKGSKDGPIQFFKKGSKNPIKWEYGLKLPYDDVSFSYNGKLHSYKDLNDVRYMKQYFPEAYEKINRLRSLKNKKIDNPFGKGKIKVEDQIPRPEEEIAHDFNNLDPVDEYLDCSSECEINDKECKDDCIDELKETLKLVPSGKAVLLNPNTVPIPPKLVSLNSSS